MVIDSDWFITCISVQTNYFSCNGAAANKRAPWTCFWTPHQDLVITLKRNKVEHLLKNNIMFSETATNFKAIFWWNNWRSSAVVPTKIHKLNNRWQSLGKPTGSSPCLTSLNNEVGKRTPGAIQMEVKLQCGLSTVQGIFNTKPAIIWWLLYT